MVLACMRARHHVCVYVYAWNNMCVWFVMGAAKKPGGGYLELAGRATSMHAFIVGYTQQQSMGLLLITAVSNMCVHVLGDYLYSAIRPA